MKADTLSAGPGYAVGDSVNDAARSAVMRLVQAGEIRSDAHAGPVYFVLHGVGSEERARDWPQPARRPLRGRRPPGELPAQPIERVERRDADEMRWQAVDTGVVPAREHPASTTLGRSDGGRPISGGGLRRPRDRGPPCACPAFLVRALNSAKSRPLLAALSSPCRDAACTSRVQRTHLGATTVCRCRNEPGRTRRERTGRSEEMTPVARRPSARTATRWRRHRTPRPGSAQGDKDALRPASGPTRAYIGQAPWRTPTASCGRVLQV